jgi:hypothetical protein
MELSKTAMLVELNIGQWTARKKDTKASRKVEEEQEAKHGVANVTKQLLAKEGIGKVTQAFQNVRWFFYAHTRPWSKGTAILKNSVYDEFIKGFNEVKLRAEEAIEEFLPLYPKLYERARKDLGKMWKEEDYPPIEKIAKKFYIQLRFLPVPKSNYFEVEGLSGKNVDEIKQNIEQGIKQGIEETTKKTYEELGVFVGRMVEALDNFGKPVKGKGKKTKKGKTRTQTFRDSLVENIQNMVDNLKTLNITDDPDLYKIGKEIEDKLCQVDGKELRNNPKIRKNIKDKADQVLKKLEGYY